MVSIWADLRHVGQEIANIVLFTCLTALSPIYFYSLIYLNCLTSHFPRILIFQNQL